MTEAHAEKVDSLMNSVGALGIYQKLFMCLIQIECFAAGMFYRSMVFAIVEPILTCNENDQGTSLANYTACEVLQKCPDNYSMEYKHGFRSIPAEWPYLIDIKCQSGRTFDPLLSLIASKEIIEICCVFAGGFLADIVGRKPMMVFGTALGAASILGMSLASNIKMYAIFFCIMTASHAFKKSSRYTLGVESTSKRYKLAITFAGTWCFTYIIVSITAYLTKDWRTMLYVGVALSCPLTIGYCLCAESPRWLLTRRKYDRAAKALNWIAFINRKPIRYNGEQLIQVLEPLAGDIKPNEKGGSKFKIWMSDLKSVKVLFTTRKLTFATIYLAVYYFIDSLALSNFIINMGNLVSNPYLSLASLGIFRLWVPFAIVSLDLFVPKFNRRRLLFTSYGLVLVPMTVSIIFYTVYKLNGDSPEWLHMTNILLMLFGVAMSLGTLYFSNHQVALELMPTVCRSGALSLLAIIASCGDAAGTQMVLLHDYWKPLQMLIPYVSLLACFFFGIFALPDTKSAPLPDTFHDVELTVKEQDGYEED